MNFRAFHKHLKRILLLHYPEKSIFDRGRIFEKFGSKGIAKILYEILHLLGSNRRESLSAQCVSELKHIKQCLLLNRACLRVFGAVVQVHFRALENWKSIFFEDVYRQSKHFVGNF